MRRVLLLCCLSTLGLLVLSGALFPAQAAPASPVTPQPSPTHKVCHLCGEDVSSGASTPVPDGVVHAVMFWMEGCGHCTYVRGEVLPPLQAEYGPAFDLLQVEIITRSDVELLYDLGDRLGVEHTGVPFLIIGGDVLVGSKQIPEELPGLLEASLQAGGVPAPVIPELERFSSRANPPTAAPGPMGNPAASPAPVPAAAEPAPAPEAADRPNGFRLAGVVLSLMGAALAFSLAAFFLRIRLPAATWPEWPSLALILAGLGIAGYLAYVETGSGDAFCGPVGDCNAVQGSPYARLFGVLPVGVMGIAGYAAMLAAWLGQRFIPRLRTPAIAGMCGMACLGVAFSIYLTYLEIYVIRAVCLWCLASAGIMTLLLLLSLPSANSILPNRTAIRKKE